MQKILKEIGERTGVSNEPANKEAFKIGVKSISDKYFFELKLLSSILEKIALRSRILNRF